VQGFAFMLGANCLFYAIFALYPTFLIQVRGLSPGQVFPYVALYSVASIIGKPVASLLARRIGERRVLLTYLVLTIPTTLLYTWFDTPLAMLMGALLIGLITNSIYGIVPTYLARRYPAEERGLGLGIASAFNSVGAVAPYAISIFTASYGLANSMTGAIMIGALFTFMVASCNTKKWFAIPEDTQTTMSRRSRNQVVNS
ncbi:MFS transporter, partial [Pseudomonas syringae]